MIRNGLRISRGLRRPRPTGEFLRPRSPGALATLHPESPRWVAAKSSGSSGTKEDEIDYSQMNFASIIDGPQIRFGSGKIANLTESSIVGASGETVVMATVASSPTEDQPTSSNDFLQYIRQQSSFVPLTVDYRQRHHAVGKIPTSGNRSDNRRPSDEETLAGRAIDRAIRPLIKKSDDSIQLSCSIQACPLTDQGGHPIALALNSASVALRDRLEEPIGCVYLNVLKDGTVLIDQSIPHQDSICELLYAGTRDKVVMMEFSGLLPEENLINLIELAHGCVQPLLDTQKMLVDTRKSQQEIEDEALRKELGLPPTNGNQTSIESESTTVGDSEQLFDEIYDFCRKEIGESSLRLFGVGDLSKVGSEVALAPRIHGATDPPLVSKKLRGRKEQMLRDEIQQKLIDFEPSKQQRDSYKDMMDDGGAIPTLADLVHSKLLKESMAQAAIKHGRRADGRGDYSNACTTIRPLSMEVPALPDCVHGSSLFTRGETQVLCTVTLGPPKDGIAIKDPYKPITDPSKEAAKELPFQDLPVGSLRYLNTQEYLESDLNTRRVMADREQTGDSGTMKERRRAFLQYDFPAFSKGEVQKGPSGGNRREIGHGALAEKALLPILPEAEAFPYAIRMTSEVTSSNGSSSMATICGVTLALLDAGVPIASPVAGISVGLAAGKTEKDRHRLLLDITGNEDYFGSMDFKIAGTDSAVTAFQLDVSTPLPLDVVSKAILLAKDGRIEMLSEMESQSRETSGGEVSSLLPRSDLKDAAPRVNIVKYDPTRKKSLVGPGGAVIRQMEDRFNVSLDLTQEGRCLLFGDDREMVRQAKAAVMDLVADVEVGGIYEGTVIELRDFGAIIEVLRNKEGLCHISELVEKEEIKRNKRGTLGLVNSVLRVGQKIDVVCAAVDPVQGTIRLKPNKKLS
eukprot:CAMPEP_0113609660 /NCGR_PEP_ID=MMETSP0017_2-20120614/4613_1 /TAXON_ID=2856 /ORGANISM="Cylindrotheca closterium" /LENGTH=912 /DNA_ID=CAMNT_0000518499 /DNA_START=43 /DNA_END=2777 /DNA_ORIENTATION=+ /assembly_acc=CAM_ASM_000147